MASGYERLPELSIGVSGFDPRVDGNPLRGVGWPEIAAALGSVPAEGADLMRAIYLHDEGAMRRTLQRLKYELGLPEGLGSSLAESTLRAFLAMRPCVHCKGSGKVRIQGYDRLKEDGTWVKTKTRWVKCETCDGDGFDHINTSAVQLMMQVSAEVWDALLAEPFRGAYEALRSWHDNAKEILLAKLKDQ